MSVKKENDELMALETRKVKALEKIANSLDALAVWFEEIDKDEWSNRVQYYMAEFHNKFVKNEGSQDTEEPKAPKNGRK